MTGLNMRATILALIATLDVVTVHASGRAAGSQAREEQALRHAAFATVSGRLATRSGLGTRSKVTNANSAQLRSVDMSAADDTPTHLGAVSDWTPEFFAPRLTPRQFLFISSATQNKIVYTELKNFKTTTGRTYPLIDSGLSQPSGISFDRERGHLYVADTGSQKIFRYSIVVDDNNGNYNVVTEGPRLTIVEGKPVKWVEVSINGDVFFSDTAENSINKITKNTVDAIAHGTIPAASLELISEKQQEATSAARSASSSSTDAMSATAAPYIYSLYEGTINTHVSLPAGVSSDGVRLFWANQQNSEKSGGAVRGEVEPQSPVELAPGGNPAPFPAYPLANTTGTGYGVAQTSNLVFFACQTTSSTGVVYGVNQESGSAVEFATGLVEPRGLVWDRDNTVFVADQAQNAVFSFPSGRSMHGAPLTKGVEFAGAFGVALMSDQDAAFKMLKSAAANVTAMFNALGLMLLIIHGLHA